MAAPEEKVVLGFTLGKILGKGGFGFVKEAELNGQQYAMKVLTRNEDWNARDEELVKGEIEVMQTLDHPNIIKVISFDMHGKYPRDGGAVDDCVIIVMELAPGGTLFDILFFTDGFSEQIIRTYMTQLTSALKEMHDKGIAHRDIKPENTILDSNFNMKICDFGLSKETDGNSLMQTNAGTLSFKAPEIICGRTYDFGVDVFALGVMYFLMLTGGVPPFKSAAVTDKWFKCIAGKSGPKFWKKHKRAQKLIVSTCENMELAVHLFFWMVSYQPTERASIEDCIGHDWFNGPKIEGEDLKTVMKELANEALTKKRESPDSGGEISQKVRGMADDLDFDQKAPEDSSRFVHGFTYAIENSEHPYVLFKSIEKFVLDLGVEDKDIVFDEDEFIMNIKITFADQTEADIVMCAYREDDVDYLTFSRKRLEEADLSIEKTTKKAGMTHVNLLIKKIITQVCQQLGNMKLDDVKVQSLSESQINDVKEHMKKMMEEAGNTNVTN